MAIIEVADLPASIQNNELVVLWVNGANAKAARVAPCLVSTDPVPSDEQLDEAKLVLIGAVSRWSEAGSGAVQSQTSGPFSQTVDNRQRTGYNLWPSEISDLQAICAIGSEKSAGAFSFTPGGYCSNHQPWCSLAFGALYCSCGADLTNGEYPLYEDA